MHDLLLDHQGELRPRDLIAYAEQLGLDLERFREDLQRHAGAPRIEEDVDSADLSGVTGTPTFFINGRRHDGAYDIDTLSAAVGRPGEGRSSRADTVAVVAASAAPKRDQLQALDRALDRDLAHRADPAHVVLVVDDSRLERGPLPRPYRAVAGHVGHRDRGVAVDDLEVILGVSLEELLPRRDADCGGPGSRGRRGRRLSRRGTSLRG